MERIDSFRETGPRYPLLRVVGILCNLAGSILMLVGVGLLIMGGLYAFSASDAPGAVPPFAVAWASLVWSFGVLLAGLQLVAVGGFLRLMIHAEENTRASAQALDVIRARLEADTRLREAIFRS